MSELKQPVANPQAPVSKPAPAPAKKAEPEKLASVTSSPHVRDKVTTTHIMLYVIIGLLPAAIFGVFNFGIQAAILMIVCIITAVLSEYVYEKLLKLPNTVKDLSAVVTGLLLGMNLPHTAPWWMAVLGSVFAIIVVKQFYGGLGKNFMNPALGGRCFLIISFTARMTTFSYHGITGATPLALSSGKAAAENGLPSIMSMFLGTEAGTIGETSALLLIIGGLFLVIMKVIDFRVPVFYVGSFAVFMAIFGAATNKDLGYFVLSHIFGGGLMLGAIFMATDYVTCPITDMGKIFYGILLGVLTGVIRAFGPSAEGVSYAIIISNMLVPLIEKATIPLAFGLVKERRKKADE